MLSNSLYSEEAIFERLIDFAHNEGSSDKNHISSILKLLFSAKSMGSDIVTDVGVIPSKQLDDNIELTVIAFIKNPYTNNCVLLQLPMVYNYDKYTKDESITWGKQKSNYNIKVVKGISISSDKKIQAKVLSDLFKNYKELFEKEKFTFGNKRLSSQLPKLLSESLFEVLKEQVNKVEQSNDRYLPNQTKPLTDLEHVLASTTPISVITNVKTILNYDGLSDKD